MKTKFLFFLVLLCSVLSFGFAGDDDPLKAFLAKFERYAEKYPREKVHIHTDKPYYSIGDTIWFKSYVVHGERNQLSNLSKILYVELINERDSIKKSLRLPVVAGLAWGDFMLSDSLTEGNYRIRAYTNWMRNFDDAYFFDKTIKIGNSLSSQVISKLDYKFSKTGMKEHVDASITYTDLDGNPLSGKTVTYDIQLDNRNVLKGKGVTDSNGNLLVKFTNTQPFILKSGSINTILELNPTKRIKKSFPVKSTSNDVSVQFFPESGNMVYNIRSRVGFKAIGADGLGRKITGYVSDNNGEKVAEFTSEYAGMGSFPFTALKGSVYTATVKFEDGSEKKVEFPKPQDTGYVLTVKNTSSEHITVNIFAVGAQNPNEELILVGQSHNVIKFVSKNKIDGNVLSATLPKSRFPSGITQFTVFNSSYQPLAERLVFIRHPSSLNMTIKTEKEIYKRREKVKMLFNAADSAMKPVQSVFSLSVINESEIPFDDVNETTIFSNLLLSSDLKGYIETPNYYFTDVSPAKDKALDNLMLTQGWRKFEWKNIAAEIFPVITYKPEKSLSISGKIITFGGKPSVGGKVMLMSSRGTGMLLDTITDAEGRFNFDNLGFNDSTTFVVQARSSKDKKNVEILIDRVPPQLVAKNSNAANAEVNINQSMLPYLKTRYNQFDEMRKAGMMRSSIMLGEVKITEAKPKVKNSTNLNGAGRADAIITAEELENCSDLAICLQGRVAGLIIQNQMAYLTRSMNSSFSGPVPMQLIYDGVAMEPDFLTSIIPSDIETVEILKSGSYTSIYGMRGGGGVLVITSKTGERKTSSNNFAFGITTYRPQGYYISRQFYSPVYAVSQPKTLPDLRTTVYWSPNIFTATDGKASAEFFTADKPGTYKAVIEGLDSNGSITRQVHRFNVK